MSSYVLKLTPDMVNPGTEGSLDTAILNGVSIQRSGYIDVWNSDNRKIVLAADGETFSDTMATITSYPGLTIEAA